MSATVRAIRRAIGGLKILVKRGDTVFVKYGDDVLTVVYCGKDGKESSAILFSGSRSFKVYRMDKNTGLMPLQNEINS